jgi:hypothetical protein
MVSDAIKLVRSFKGCQYYAKQTHLLAHALQTIPITWPFTVWGLNLVGPLKRTTTHLLIAIDKFSKWIEARPITNVRSEQAVLFFTDIIHRFEVPNCIITDNDTQFTGKRFLEFYDDRPCALVGRGSPKDKWPSETCQWHGPTRPEAENLQQIEQTRQEMGHRAPLGPKNDTESSHRVHSVFLGLWV